MTGQIFTIVYKYLANLLPVPCCPNGHFTCIPCLGKMRDRGSMQCPTCRVKMGTGKSCLAKVLIENVDHLCIFELCQRYSAMRARERRRRKVTLYMKLKYAYQSEAWARVAILREEIR